MPMNFAISLEIHIHFQSRIWIGKTILFIKEELGTKTKPDILTLYEDLRLGSEYRISPNAL